MLELLRLYGLMDVDVEEEPDSRAAHPVLFAETLSDFEGSWALGSLVHGLMGEGQESILGQLALEMLGIPEYPVLQKGGDV